MQNIHIFYGCPAMFVVTCFSVLLVSQSSQHSLTWLPVFSNWKILIVLILLRPIRSLNWAIKLLNWVTISLLEIVMRCIPENNLVGQLYHTVGFIDSFQFFVHLVALYSYLQHPLFIVSLSQLWCFFGIHCCKWLTSETGGKIYCSYIWWLDWWDIVV